MDGCSTVTPTMSSRRSVDDARLHAERVQLRREGETLGPRADYQDVGSCGHRFGVAGGRVVLIADGCTVTVLVLDLDMPPSTPGSRCPHAFLGGLSSKARQGPIGPKRPGTSLRHFCCASANRGECVSTDGGMLCTVPASGLGSGNARTPRARIQRANLTSACSSCGSGCAAGAGPRGRRARQA
jgi:hypothetical protein